jgi:hypothetical protein
MPNELLITVAPAISAIAASLAFTAAVYFNRRTELRVVRPVLVFVYKEEGWYVSNVGNGPALDIVVAQQIPHRQWEKAVRIPPLGKDREFKLHWIEDDNIRGLGATYSSFDGLRYTSECHDDLTTVKSRDRFPHFGAIMQEWKLRKMPNPGPQADG